MTANNKDFTSPESGVYNLPDTKEKHAEFKVAGN